MNISENQAIKYYKYKLEIKIKNLKKEISDLSKSIKYEKEIMTGYNPELAEQIIDNVFKLKAKQSELSKILNIIGD